MRGLPPFLESQSRVADNGQPLFWFPGSETQGRDDDGLFRSGVRDGGQPVQCHRQSSRNSHGRARPPADAETGDHGVLSDPPGRRHGRGVRRLSRPASPDDGADQGRHTVRALRRYRRGGGACDLDELEMRAGRAALWRRQGRCQCRSLHDLQARTGGPVAALHAGDDPLRRPAYRRDGPGHGHQ